MRCLVCDGEMEEWEGEICEDCQNEEWLLIDDLGMGVDDDE